MPKYIVLSTWTEKGVAAYKESPDRVVSWRKKAAESGVEVREVYAVIGGPCDTIALVSAPSDEAMARVSLDLCALGNVHTQTLRAFTEEEMKKITK
jgi:uncharacterized protein with GYD domain